MIVSKRKSKTPKESAPQFDDVLKRMLASPPNPKIRQKAETKTLLVKKPK
jgi:hypothetical protein